MILRKAIRGVACSFALLGIVYAFQRPFREYPGVEYPGGLEPPPDYQEKTEWVFARLMFPGGPLDGYRGRFDGDFRLGLSLWTQDYPRADRHFVQAVRRLTRVHVRSVEQPLLLEDGDAYDWPWLYAVQAGEWGLTEQEGRLLREYCLRGGFFFADDFHGPDEWAEFAKRIKFAFPDRPIVDIENGDQIFHTVYDINDKFVIPGAEHLREGSKNGGRVARWVGVYDDKGRLMVVGNFNQDTGDAWEWADSARYPEKFSDLAIRLGVNYIVYAMTH
ncbi:MAG TPA: DUF4159 domain-containing protein [Bryobacteraceae bacterium]|jgi:hypothetical protein